MDLLLAARGRGFEAALVEGTAERLGSEIEHERPVVLMLRLLDAPGRRRDVYHYVVVDGADSERQLFRFQFGDGQARWAPLESVEKGWRASAHALLVVWPREDTDAALRRAVALESEGRIDDAAATYRQVLEVRPASVRAWVDLGNAEATRRSGPGRGESLPPGARDLARRPRRAQQPRLAPPGGGHAARGGRGARREGREPAGAGPSSRPGHPGADPAGPRPLPGGRPDLRRGPRRGERACPSPPWPGCARVWPALGRAAVRPLADSRPRPGYRHFSDRSCRPPTPRSRASSRRLEPGWRLAQVVSLLTLPSQATCTRISCRPGLTRNES